MSRYDQLFFDLDGTLIYEDPPFPESLKMLCKLFGLNMPPDRLESALQNAYNFYRKEVLNFDAEDEFRIRYIHRLLIDLGFQDSSRELSRQISEAYMKKVKIRVFDDVKPTLKALQKRGYRLALVTGRIWSPDSILKKLELDRFIHEYHFAGKYKILKEDPLFYPSILRDVIRDVEKAVIIDDDPETLVQANSFGIRSILIDRPIKHPESPYYTRIRDLIELLKLLDEL